jgi:hypothetical protein
MREKDFCFLSQILQTIQAQVPQPPLMTPIGEGEGAAWASLYIYVLCDEAMKRLPLATKIEAMKCLTLLWHPAPCFNAAGAYK